MTDSSTPPSRRGWRHPTVIAHVAALLTSIGALAAAFQACSQPAPPEEKADRVYDALRERIEEQAEAQRRQASDVRDLRAWLRGYLEATGVRVPDAPGAPAQKVRVVLEPAPAGSSGPMTAAPTQRGRAPEPQSVRVLTPLPVPRAVPPDAAGLPASADAL